MVFILKILAKYKRNYILQKISRIKMSHNKISFLFIISSLAYQIAQFECNVCQKGQSSNNCTSANSKFIKLRQFNDFNFDKSFLLSSSNSNNNLKCLASCGTIDQCAFSIYKDKKCYFCNEIVINYLKYNSTSNGLVYQKPRYISSLNLYWIIFYFNF